MKGIFAAFVVLLFLVGSIYLINESEKENRAKQAARRDSGTPQEAPRPTDKEALSSAQQDPPKEDASMAPPTSTPDLLAPTSSASTGAYDAPDWTKGYITTKTECRDVDPRSNEEMITFYIGEAHRHRGKRVIWCHVNGPFLVNEKQLLAATETENGRWSPSKYEPIDTDSTTKQPSWLEGVERLSFVTCRDYDPKTGDEAATVYVGKDEYRGNRILWCYRSYPYLVTNEKYEDGLLDGFLTGSYEPADLQ